MENAVFTMSLSVKIPPHEIGRIREWINTQHTGKPEIPIGDPVSRELDDAHWRINAVNRVSVDFQVDRDGYISLNSTPPH